MDQSAKTHSQVKLLIFFCFICFFSAVTIGWLVISSQATASSQDEVQPKKASDDTRDKSIYKTVGHYYTDASQYKQDGGAWADLTTSIETAMADNALSHDE